MMDARRKRFNRGCVIAGALMTLGLVSGCASGVADRARVVAGDDPAQPTCQAADFLKPGAKTPPTPDGCWNEANLAKMVADPADLARGRRQGPASGAREALAVDAYRRGQVKPLAGQDATSSPALTIGALGVTGP